MASPTTRVWLRNHEAATSTISHIGIARGVAHIQRSHYQRTTQDIVNRRRRLETNTDRYIPKAESRGRLHEFLSVHLAPRARLSRQLTPRSAQQGAQSERCRMTYSCAWP